MLMIKFRFPLKLFLVFIERNKINGTQPLDACFDASEFRFSHVSISKAQFKFNKVRLSRISSPQFTL